MLRLIGKTGQQAGNLHGFFRLAIQHCIAGHRHHIFNAGLAIQKRQQFGVGKAAVETNADARLGK